MTAGITEKSFIQAQFSDNPAVRLELLEKLENGLELDLVEATAKSLGVETRDFATFGVMPRRTLSHSTAKGRFSAEQSQRIARFFRIMVRATDTFGDTERAERWLKRPSRPLRDHAPFELLDSEEGARLIEDLLDRIDHGLAA
ncbi:type II RES/Xre toxin-antitoxin system antitoxin [Aestuariispira ectoiniformans]|uniref:type II RES/Xre toxin-antitoxin system antitoxin n=1 Tax=Aestuariispira ectoiniformans TaxID=2775080 RepID=UPI00223AA6C1|nr:antitoxin Xre/MbcA/ParS toxin-binding domain-containing protein [Aestuariispira ectoiniformans]